MRAEILKETGFEICTFGPDEDECEVCNQPFRQLYWRSFGNPECWNDGEYLCAECVENSYKAEFDA